MTASVSAGVIAAASQSTVFVTMVDDGGGEGGRNSSAVTGLVFGRTLSLLRAGGSGDGSDVIQITGGAVAQSFFRSYRFGGQALVNSADASSFTAGDTNTWNFPKAIGAVTPGVFTVYFFR